MSVGAGGVRYQHQLSTLTGREFILLPKEHDMSHSFLTNTISLTITWFCVWWLDLHILSVNVHLEQIKQDSKVCEFDEKKN